MQRFDNERNVTAQRLDYKTPRGRQAAPSPGTASLLRLGAQALSAEAGLAEGNSVGRYELIPLQDPWSDCGVLPPPLHTRLGEPHHPFCAWT